MAGRRLSLDDFTESLAGLSRYQEELYGGADQERSRMLRTLKTALKQELTPRQLECVRLYYFERKKIVDVAEELGIDISTTSRHLKKARARVGRILEYVYPSLGERKEDSSQKQNRIPF